MIEMGFAKQL